jgi:hypothetical protein
LRVERKKGVEAALSRSDVPPACQCVINHEGREEHKEDKLGSDDGLTNAHRLRDKVHCNFEDSAKERAHSSLSSFFVFLRALRG